MSCASCKPVSRRCAGLLGLAGGDQQPREYAFEEGAIDVLPDRAPGVDERGQGRDVGRQRGRIEVVGAERGQGANGRLPGSAPPVRHMSKPCRSASSLTFANRTAARSS